MENPKAAMRGAMPRGRSRSPHRHQISRLLVLAFTASCGASESTAPQPDFTINAGPFTPGQVYPGDSTTLTVGSAFLNGFSQSVAFRLTAPAGFSAAFSQCNTVLSWALLVPPGATCNATVHVDSAVAAGIFGLVFEASTNGYTSRRTTAPLPVLPPRPLPANFSVTPSTRTLTIVRGDSADVLFTISPRPPGAADVTFTVLQSFAGSSLTWIPSVVIPAMLDTVRVRVTVAATASLFARNYFIQARLPGKPVQTIVLTVNVVATAVAAQGLGGVAQPLP